MQADTAVLAQKADKVPEIDYEPTIPPNTTWGISTIAFEFAAVYLSKNISPSADAGTGQFTH